MSDIVQGNQSFTQIRETGGKTTITSLSKENVLPITYQVIKGTVAAPTTAGNIYQVLDSRGIPIIVSSGQVVRSVEAVASSTFDAASLLTLVLQPVTGGLIGYTGSVGSLGTTNAIALSSGAGTSALLAGPAPVVSTLKSTGPVYINSGTTGGDGYTLLVGVTGSTSNTAGSLEVLVTLV